MPRKRPSLAGPIIELVLALILVIAYLAYVAWQKRQAERSPLQQTADLVSDDRILYGGAPRPAPGAGEEVQFTVLKNKAYVVGYSESRKDPLWSAYRVHAVTNPQHLPRPPEF